MMKTYISGLIILAIIILSSQSLTGKEEIPGGKIFGVVQDKESKSPIEYATIAVYNSADSSLVTGTITDSEGAFSVGKIEDGDYYIVINFLGYRDMHRDNVTISRNTTQVALGEIYLETASELLEEVTVVNERNAIDFHIDKKVVTVGKQMTASSLSAVEVLENVPSIRVDIEGNVSLRGSTGFTVLVDGKPTVLDPSEVLRQTPASTIENIEIITNPSSRYQPDGTGGIINIVTKKNRMMGLQGLFNAKAGRFGAYSGDFLLNYRKNALNFYLGGDYGKNPYPGFSYEERHTTRNDTSTIIRAEGESESIRSGGGIRMGMDWDLTPSDNLSLGFRFGNYMHGQNSMLDYLTYQVPGTVTSNELSLNEGGRGGNYYNVNATYTHAFEQQDHELMLQYSHRLYMGDEFSENYLMDGDGMVSQGTRTTEKGPSTRFELKLDYTRPLGSRHGLETGFQFRSGNSTDATELYDFDADLGDFVIRPDRSNTTYYKRNIYALYGIFKGESGKLGYQAGLRGEYTYRDVTAEESVGENTIDRFDYFPTLHLSYQLPKENQLMASYSRRIDRPRSYYLEPFLTWMDMYNVRSGNPALEPEYIDAMELGFIHSRENSQLSLEAYYRIKQNLVERVKEVYTDGVLLHSFKNVGTDYSLGMEALYNIALFPWWELNLMADFYDYRIESERDGNAYEFQSFNWGTRWNNTFRIGEMVRFQLDGNYNSATITTQGKDEGYYSFNAAVRSDFLDRKLSLVLQVRDVFATMERVSIIEDVDLYNISIRNSRAPLISLTASYRLNNFKERAGNPGGGSGGEDF